MRFYTVLASRPEFYDRNPSNQSQEFATGAVAPHGDTQRWSYQCPNGKKSMIDLVALQVQRVTAAGVSGEISDRIGYTPNGGTAQNLTLFDLADNTVLAEHWRSQTQNGIMLAGDLLTYNTSDGSTGGTVYHYGSAKVFQFDA